MVFILLLLRLFKSLKDKSAQPNIKIVSLDLFANLFKFSSDIISKFKVK